MTIRTALHDYYDGTTHLRASVAWDDARRAPLPGVLVAHAWRGRTEFEDQKAIALAELGYVGFALDMYGAGISGTSPAENAALMQPFLDDRAMLQRRMQLALAELCSLEQVDEQQTAAIGFCFGGLCVLDLARSGANVDGVVSFHGLLDPPGNTGDKRIRAQVLLMHGWDDPMAKPEAVIALGRELSAQQADWQLHAFGNTLHAFSNPAAADPDNGLQYDANADRRSWLGMQHFLNEVFP